MDNLNESEQEEVKNIWEFIKSKNKENSTEWNALNDKKKAVIYCYLQNLGSVTSSCNQAGIGKTTYYRWLKEDKNFKECIDNIDVDDFLLGEAKKGLLKNIRKGDTASIIFTLKSKGKKEGFTEKQEVEHSSKGFSLNVTKTYEKPKEKDSE